jgi:hypothetical protein
VCKTIFDGDRLDVVTLTQGSGSAYVPAGILLDYLDRPDELETDTLMSYVRQKKPSVACDSVLLTPNAPPIPCICGKPPLSHASLASGSLICAILMSPTSTSKTISALC